MRKLVLILMAAALVFAGSFRDLYPFLIDLPGWNGGKPGGSSTKVPFVGATVVEAHREYTKGDAWVKVTIGKGKGIMMAWTPFATNVEYEDEHGWAKVQTINGFQVGIQYDKESKGGSVVVNLTVGQQSVGLLELEYSGITADEALKLARKFDWKKIASVLQNL